MDERLTLRGRDGVGYFAGQSVIDCVIKNISADEYSIHSV